MTSARLIADAVALTRTTREREDIRQGSSVRGAIDLALIVDQLAAMRAVALPAPPDPTSRRDLPADYTTAVWDAMTIALSGRIQLEETLASSPEEVLREIWTDHFLLLPAAAEPG